MKQVKNPESFWDRRAKKFNEKAQEDDSYTRVVGVLAKYLQEDDTVLDYACGTGGVSFKIAADVKEVHGIDTSAGMIDLAKAKAREAEVDNVQFSRRTLFDDKLNIESYEVVLALNILHLLEDARQAIQRVSDLLKPGGLMVSVTPCLGEAGFIARTFLPLISKVVALPYLRKFTVSELTDLVQDGGFHVLESEVLDGTIPSWFVVTRKR